MYCAEEVYTIEGKKADVLLAFNRLGGETYICAVEAKSKRTLNSLKPDTSDIRQLWWSRGILVVIAFLALLAYGRELVLDLLECFLLLAGIFGAVHYTGKLLDHTAAFPFLELPVLDQLDQYPANENWVAVPSDVFESKQEMNTLFKYCKRQGVGLLVVDANAMVTKLAPPYPRGVGNDHTAKYKKEKEIVAATQSGSSYRSPFEKLQNRRRFGSLILLLAFFSLMALVLGTNGERRPMPGNEPSAPWLFTDPAPYAEAPKPTAPPPARSTPPARTSPASSPTPPLSGKTNPPATAPPAIPIPTTSSDKKRTNAPVSQPVNPAPRTPPRKTARSPSPPNLPACDIWRAYNRQFIAYDKLFRSPMDAEQRLKTLHRLSYNDFFIVSTNCFDDWMPTDHYLIVLPTVYPTLPALRPVDSPAK